MLQNRAMVFLFRSSNLAKQRLRKKAFSMDSADVFPIGSDRRSAFSRRRVYSLNRNWRYRRQTLPGASGLELNNEQPIIITLPHANCILPWHGFDHRSYQFTSLYQRAFSLSPDLRDRRVFVDFAGVMTVARISLNGIHLAEHRGGYLPFSVELTSFVEWGKENLLEVEVDSREYPDIPPFGGEVDYLTFGGIYREVSLRLVPDSFIENVFARPLDVLSDRRRVDVDCWINHAPDSPSANFQLVATLEDDPRVCSSGAMALPINEGRPAEFVNLPLFDLGPVDLWNPHHPRMYSVTVRLYDGDTLLDDYYVRIGFRDVRFTPEGFLLNGQAVKLRGLNRHQTFPYVGGAMPGRVQRRDALILRNDLKCNVVRTSHYPQATQFLDCCDEIGLMVLEEIPGWQHVGDQAWQDAEARNLEQMIRRDWNHPSIILWGVRIDESKDMHDFYAHMNAVAHNLDETRPTGGVRNIFESELLEDVFTMNDFGFPLRAPNHPLYLNTEFCGHMFPVKQQDSVDRVMEQARKHAAVHNQLASDPRYAGGIGWCAFDYNTTSDFGSGDGVCYHGVCDIFRIPKPAGYFYRSQCDPEEEIVLEPCFHWAIGDASWPWVPGGQSMQSSLSQALIASNCDHIKVYLNDLLLTEADPDRENFGNLRHPLFRINLGTWLRGELRMDGYIERRLVVTRKLSSHSADASFHVEPDDAVLKGDGIDTTRLVMRVTDCHGGRRPFATGAIELKIDGPGEIIGENPFALVGGVGAVWIRTKQTPGIIRLQAKHPLLGLKIVEIAVLPEPEELV
jgi:beta-galactosidase